jgi:hypothetical protein
LRMREEVCSRLKSRSMVLPRGVEVSPQESRARPFRQAAYIGSGGPNGAGRGFIASEKAMKSGNGTLKYRAVMFFAGAVRMGTGIRAGWGYRIPICIPIISGRRRRMLTRVRDCQEICVGGQSVGESRNRAMAIEDQ